MKAIEVEDLRKTWRVPISQPGLMGTLRGLFHRQYRTIEAVRGIGFSIEPGERVGFLGPNGAGKTTTLKMLAGLLHPTSGAVSVLGMVPGQRTDTFLGRITLVMGQKQQLLWDLPPRETFALNEALFDLEPAAAKRTRERLIDVLRIGGVVDKPTRNLSLGERMKCELVAALQHQPEVLFLDEPTIGLDVEMQVEVRKFIADLNRETGATVLLTSHYMQDIEALTPRLILIDRGKLRFDGTREELAQRCAPERKIVVKGSHPDLADLGFVAEQGAMVAVVPLEETNQRLQQLLGRHPDIDVEVQRPPLEEVIARSFRQEGSE